MNEKLEEYLAKIEEIATELNKENDQQSKTVALTLLVLASSTYLDLENEAKKLLDPLATKIANGYNATQN